METSCNHGTRRLCLPDPDQPVRTGRRVALPVYTPTEKAVSRLGRLGRSAGQIAQELDLSVRQVRRCQKSVRLKAIELRRLTLRVLKGERFSEINQELLIA